VLSANHRDNDDEGGRGMQLNSHNDWSPLKEVIVGSAENYTSHDREVSFDAAPISGFGWEAMPIPALNLRDNTLIVGEEIIETPPAIRSRYLETRLLAPVFKRYFDSGAKWTTMPRPLLTDHSFDLSYARSAETTLGGPTEPVEDPEPSPYDVGYEMMLDGAQCRRLG